MKEPSILKIGLVSIMFALFVIIPSYSSVIIVSLKNSTSSSFARQAPCIAAPPSVPLDPHAIAGDGQVFLSWNVPSSNGGSPITNYKIFRGTSPGIEPYLDETGNITSYLDIAVLNGQIYYYAVCAVNGDGDSVQSVEASATPAAIPSAPLALLTTAGNMQIVLTWDTPASNGGAAITAYRIFQGTIPGGEVLLATIGVVLTHTVTGLTNGIRYYFKVAAMNVMGTGANSTEVSATPVTIPSAPQALSVTPGNMQVILTWTSPASNGGSTITNYRVYRGTTPGGEILLTTLGNVFTFTSTSLTNGQLYYFIVSAVNSVGASANSTEATAMPGATPTAPQNFTATAGPALVMLSWTAPASNGGSPITNYKIYRGMSAGDEMLLTIIDNTTSYLDTSVVNDQIYYYTVRAVNSEGDGIESSEEEVTPSIIAIFNLSWNQILNIVLLFIAGGLISVNAAENITRKKQRNLTQRHAINDPSFHSGFGDSVTKNVGTSSSDVAAGDHTHEEEEEEEEEEAPLVSPGSMLLFYGDSAPAGWLLCDGRAISKKDYADLFAAIGTAFGGDGNPKFNLPDLRKKISKDKGATTTKEEGKESDYTTINYIIKT